MAAICKAKDKDSWRMLLSPAGELVKIRPSTGHALEKAGLGTTIQILLQLPVRFRDRGFQADPAQRGRIITARFFAKSKNSFRNIYSVKGMMEPLGGGLPQALTLRFFRRPYFWGDLDGDFYVSGTITKQGRDLIMYHPDYVEKSPDKIPEMEPVYYSTGLKNPTFMRLVQRLISAIQPKIEDWQNCSLPFMEAIQRVHTGNYTHQEREEARLRLLRDEMLAYKLTWENIKWPATAVTIKFRGMPCRLPFKLTKSQQGALRDIGQDLGSGKFMYRLIQGDVGSGKTIVAFVSMIQAATSGYQACLMAPTQVVARQHYNNLVRLLEGTSIEVGYIASTSRWQREEQAKYKLIVGTHALLQKGTMFKNLGLVVIDEQHRFGVAQRSRLFQKGCKCHVLMMSATPIPRTLFLASYCGLKSSRLDRIEGRQPVDTRLICGSRIREVWERLKKPLSEGVQVYWVCPLVEGESDATAAKTRFEEITQHFPEWRVGLLHGSMSGAEKEKISEEFLEGRIHLLVTTTIVEVGVDTTANIMVIEHAERFGLVTLHQLRGRVGRNRGRATCILLYGSNLTENAFKRLSLLKSNQDGVALAKEDMRMRGKGDIGSKLQSGNIVFRFGSLDEAERQAESIAKWDAHQEAKSFLVEAFSLALEAGKG